MTTTSTTTASATGDTVMSSIGVSSRKRRTTAVRRAAAAKERRQKIFVVGALFVLIAVLAYELPQPRSSAAARAPVRLRARRSVGTRDAHAGRAVQDPAGTPRAQPPRRSVRSNRYAPRAERRSRDVAAPAGAVDPFAARSTPEAAIAPPAPQPVSWRSFPARSSSARRAAAASRRMAGSSSSRRFPRARASASATAFAASGAGRV